MVQRKDWLPVRFCTGMADVGASFVGPFSEQRTCTSKDVDPQNWETATNVGWRLNVNLIPEKKKRRRPAVVLRRAALALLVLVKNTSTALVQLTRTHRPYATSLSCVCVSHLVLQHRIVSILLLPSSSVSSQHHNLKHNTHKWKKPVSLQDDTGGNSAT